MKKCSTIRVGQVGHEFWIRPEGKGTFEESSLIKGLAEEKATDPDLRLIFDLEECSRMDSTFMGMLAGLGIKLRKGKLAPLKVIGTSEKTKASLTELGLAQLLDICEPDDDSRTSEIRASLSELTDVQENSKEELILKCHEDLCDADEKNLSKFKTVLDVLGSKKSSP